MASIFLLSLRERGSILGSKSNGREAPVRAVHTIQRPQADLSHSHGEITPYHLGVSSYHPSKFPTMPRSLAREPAAL